MKKMTQPFYLVTLSPWPLLTSFSLMIMLFGVVNWFHQFNLSMMIYGMILLILCLFQWWRDVIRESTYQGFHSKVVVSGLKLGMILFIISEIFFFFSIFWCYFHMFLSPSIEIGVVWPPNNIILFNPFHIPLLNTLILLMSGVMITWSHQSIIMKNNKEGYYSLMLTIILGLVFTLLQYSEYKESSYSISDSVFGSVFYMSTGFHGLHVIVGTIFLIINLVRVGMNNFSNIHHFGFEAASWYWHFVDVVWLFLYLLIYYWIW